MSAKNNKIKILQVLYGLLIGGSERLASFLSYAIDKDRFDTMVLGLYGSGHLTNELKSHNVPYHFFDYSNSIDKKIGLHIKLYEFLQREKVDIIQVHGSYPLTRIIPAAKLTKTKIIYTEHAKRSLQTTPRLRFMTKIASMACDKVVVVSNNLKDYMEKELKISETIVIQNGVDLKKFNNKMIAEEIEGLGLRSDDTVFVGVIGRLTDAKDHIGMLKAWSHINHNYANKLVLVLAGDGELKDELKNKTQHLGITDSVIFLGQRDDIPEIISRMDLMILPSKREGFPISILEYMAMNKPVIATNVGGVPEIIEHGVNGYLVPPEDPDALADAINRYMTNHESFEKMAEHARKKVEDKFNTDCLINQYESLYEDVYNG